MSILSVLLVDHLTPPEHRRLRRLNRVWMHEVNERVPIYHIPARAMHMSLRRVSEWISLHIYWKIWVLCAEEIFGRSVCPKRFHLTTLWHVTFPVAMWAPTISILDQCFLHAMLV